MNWKDFESNVRETLEIDENVNIDKNEPLEGSEYWSSMHALLIMALAESEYNISISGEELRNSKTLQDLYNLFESKVA